LGKWHPNLRVFTTRMIACDVSIVASDVCEGAYSMTSVSAVSSEQFASLLARRRSVRDFSDMSITLPRLLSVVAAGQGITGPGGLRATPSAHRLFPLVLRIVVRRVQGLEQGLYDYFPETNELVSVATLPAEGA